MARVSRQAHSNLLIPRKISELLREVGLIGLLAVIVYLAFSLSTYSPSDPGPMLGGGGGGGGDIANLGGRVGAWFADWMFAVFGRGAYLFLLLLCALGWRIHRRRESRYGAWSRVLPPAGVALALVGACGLEQMYFSAPPSFHAGGNIGYYGAMQLTAYFAQIGATVIFIALGVTGITLATHLSWFNLMDRTGYRAFVFAAWLKTQIEKRADRRVGERARKQRQVAVTRSKASESEKKPPKIEPMIHDAPQGERKQRERQANLFPESGGGALPPLSLLESPAESHAGYSRDELELMSQLLVKKLKDFNVDITVEAVQPGPVITRFEVEPGPGIRASQIIGLSGDLARSLSVESVRVVENIAGKTVIGIEIPNQSREIVRLVEGLSSREYEKSASPLTLVLGKDIAGNPAITDLMKMPHILIAGTTGSGKSVCINALILSMVYKATPEQIRFIMVDPKYTELSVYDGIPHLLVPVVTDMTKAANALSWCIGEMDRRFKIMAAIGVRNIAGHNKKVADAAAAGEPLLDPMVDEAGAGAGADEAEALQALPYVVVIVDELAELVMRDRKKIEDTIIRIAQRARAAGIHLVLATQRPSVDVVTGLIKANVPTRIAFQVSSRADSRTVLDRMGAEQLLGQGDMLFLPPGTGFARRVHGAFVSDDEVAQVVAHLKSGARPVYLDEVTEGGAGSASDGGVFPDGEGEADPLYDDAVRFVTQSRRASISALQRALRVGYNRAARMIEIMEESGVVGPSDNGKREVLAPPPPED